MGCNSEETKEPTIETPTITVNAFFTTDYNKEYHDVESKVFIYYDICTIDLLGYNYLNEGIFEKENSRIEPEQSSHINEYGTTIIEPLYTDRTVTILVESHYFEGRLSYTCYPSIPSSIIFTTITHP